MQLELETFYLGMGSVQLRMARSSLCYELVPVAPHGIGPARGPWTNLGRLPLRVFSIGKCAFQKSTTRCRPRRRVRVVACSESPALSSLDLELVAFFFGCKPEGSAASECAAAAELHWHRDVYSG